MYKNFAPDKLERVRKTLVKKGYPYWWPEVSDWIKTERGMVCEVCGLYSRDVVVHHIDGDKQNCTWENLLVVCPNYNKTGDCAAGKPYQCPGCGRPIRHRGYCMACNIERKEG